MDNKGETNFFKNHIDFFFLIIILIIGLIIRLPLCSISKIPLSYDESVFLSAAFSVTKGKILYVDIFDHKTPFLILFYSIMITLFGSNIFIMRLISSLIFILTAMIIYLTVKALYSRKNAIISTIIFLIWYSQPPLEQLLIMQENFMMLFLVLSFYLFVIEEKMTDQKKNLIKFLNGLSFSLAVLSKQSAILFCLAYIIAILSVKTPSKNVIDSIMHKIRLIIPYMVGGIIFPAILILYYVHINSFSSLMFALVEANIQETHHSLLDKYYTLSRYLNISNAIVILAVPCALFCLFNRRPLTSILLYWIISFLAFLIVSSALYPHYFYQISAPLVYLMSGSFHYLSTELRIKLPRLSKLSNCSEISFRKVLDISWYIIFVYLFLFPLVPMVGYYANDRVGEGYQSIELAAEYIEENSLKNDSIFAFPNYPIIYFLSGRTCASEYIYFSWVIWNKLTLEDINEIISSIATAKFIVSFWSDYNINKTIESIPKSLTIFNFILNNCSLDTKYDGLGIYSVIQY